MKRREDIQAELLDRAIQRMLEGKAPFEDSAQADAGMVAGLRPLVDTASRVRILVRARAPLPDFVASLEGRLLKQKRISPPVLAPRAFPVPAGFGWGRLRTAALIAVLAVMVMIGSGLGAASVSAQALPGDSLYPVKRGFEEVSLTFSFSPGADVQLLSDFTDRRLAEVEQLAAQGRESDLLLGLEYYEQTLSRLDAAIKALPSDSGSAQLDDLQARLIRHAEVLSALRDRLPEQAQPALDLAVEHSQKTSDTVGELRRNLGPEFVPPGVLGTSTQEPISNADGSSPTTTPEADTETATPEPSRTPEPSATSESTVTPTASETQEPTKTPKPSDTPKPTDLPKPSRTPKPTDAPKPTDTPKPVDPTKPINPSSTPKPTDSPLPSKKPPEPIKPSATPTPSSNTGASTIG
jgi:outer membrane biosynthesis protein TonB